MSNDVIIFLKKNLFNKKSVIIFAFMYFPLSFLLLTKYPLWGEDECWFSDVSYYFLLNGSFNSITQNGLKEMIGGGPGHGVIYFLVDTISFWLLGVGLFQARLPVFITGIFILFLIYKITLRLYNKRTAILSVIIVALSDTFFRSSHAFEAHFFLLFFLLACFYLYLILEKIGSAELLPFVIGFLSMASIEIHWIGTILPCVFFVLFCVGKKISKIKNIQIWFFLLGSLVSFLFLFLFIRIYLIEGWEIFNYKLNLYYGITQSKSYLWSLTNEPVRYFKYFSKQNVKWFELLLIMIAIYYSVRRKNKSDILVLTAVVTYMFLLALVVKNKNPYMILFIPFIYILISSVIDDMFTNLMNLKAVSKWVLVVLCLIIPYFISGILYITIRHVGANYSQYVKDLKQIIPKQSTVMGWMPLWYGFYDQKFYENSFYIGRALERELGYEYLKGTPDELYEIKNKAYVDFIKSKNIDYLILDENAKKGLISAYYMKFDGTEKNFIKISELNNKYYGGKSSPKSTGYITEIYKIDFK